MHGSPASCLCEIVELYRRNILAGVKGLVCRVTKRWTEVCSQSWYNPWWLTGLETQINLPFNLTSRIKGEFSTGWAENGGREGGGRKASSPISIDNQKFEIVDGFRYSMWVFKLIQV